MTETWSNEDLPIPRHSPDTQLTQKHKYGGLSMFSMFKKKDREVSINDTQQLIATPGETILQAGTRQGIRMPHNCRVGGCGECKCKLISGKVKELTESAYILSADELDQGYILTCQSVPKTDISIEIERLENNGPNYEVKKLIGKVTRHQQLTHDTVEIQVSLPEPLSYESGQYAQLSIPGVIEQSRAYSFAAAASDAHKNQTVSFFIRAVPGGEMSNHMQQASVIGSTIEIEGPYGDFYLRDADEPMLCVAGGSGLAPLKSLLEEAIKNNVSRPVTFLFGARTQEDLYCIEEVAQIAKDWANEFQFIPVLSNEPIDSDWNGLRGFVTEAIEKHLSINSSGNEKVYMCGPPPMIDAVEDTLQTFSIRPTQIYYDKFLDQRYTKNINTAA